MGSRTPVNSRHAGVPGHRRPDGRIYVLSDEWRCIARLQATLDPEDRLIEVDRIWGLPDRLH